MPKQTGTQTVELSRGGGRYTINADGSHLILGPVYEATITLDDTGTPDVSGGNSFITGGTTAITDFNNGVVGQTIKVLAKGTITLTNGTPIKLAGAGNYSMTITDTLTLHMFDDQVWSEIGRSVN